MIVPAFSEEERKYAVEQAADLLRRGMLVALPTETVYGLAANAFNVEAVRSIYLAKGRPSNNPIIVHVTGSPMARRCVEEWPPEAELLAQSFWPGPLSIVLHRAACIPNVVTGGGETVAIRCPAHPVFQAVVRACGFPLAAPSANRSNHISPTKAEHVQESLGNHVALIVDGRACSVGIESTVVDMSNPKAPRVLRPGMISEESIRRVLGLQGAVATEGDKAKVALEQSGVLKSPGQLPRHYSPQTVSSLFRGSVDELENFLSQKGCKPERCALIRIGKELPPHLSLGMDIGLPNNPAGYAEQIYAALYRCDAQRLDVIVIQAPPETIEWRAVWDRLKRATKR